jgi:hypothetical protein
MKTVFNTSEIPHIWASQTQNNGRSHGNIFFEGKTIYSYGHHFPIATIYAKDENIVFFNSGSYSSSTGHHQSMTRQAVRHKIIFTVPVVNLNSQYKCDLKQAHEKNIAYYLNGIENFVNKQKRARKYSYVSNINGLLSEFQEYVKLFKLSHSLKKAEKELLNYSDASAILGGCNFTNLREKQAKAQSEKQIRDAKKRLFAWLGCKVPYKKDKVYLRSHGDIIETTRGASVPIREARILYDRIRMGKDIKGFQIGYYTVIGINGTLKIGCHEIERDEINRLAKSLNWIEQKAEVSCTS